MRLLKIKNTFFIIGLLLCLTACEGQDTWCIGSNEDTYSTDGSIINSNSYSILVNGDGSDPSIAYSKGRWVKSGVNVYKDDLVKMSAIGDIVTAKAYGLSADSDSEFDNGGLGYKYIINANSTNATGITSDATSTGDLYNFVINQNITVTTAVCGPYGTSEPTKWTWQNGWNYNAVRCHYEGAKRGDTENFQADDPDCKAIRGCDKNFWGEYSYKGWKCGHRTILTTDIYVTDPDTFDTCPETSANYNCQSNEASNGACYNKTKFIREDGYCDGRHNKGGERVSDTYPYEEFDDAGNKISGHENCGTDESRYNESNVTVPQYNECGINDTCWNTDGYRMYAIQAGVQCPNDERCTHLKQNSGSGSSFAAIGGSLYLQIIAPGSENTTDVTALQDQIDTNNSEITRLEGEIDNLEVTLNGQLDNITYYVYDVNRLQEDTVSLYEGLNSNNQVTIDELKAIDLQYEDTTDGATDLEESLDIFSQQIEATDGSKEWVDTLDYMETQSNAIITDTNNLTVDLNASSDDSKVTTTTTQSLLDYQADSTTILAELNTAIDNAQATETDIETKEQEIADLQAENAQLEQDIMAASNTSNTGLVGGYTAYVKADEFVVSNGKHLKVVISTEDPNVSGTTYTTVTDDLTSISIDYTMPESGNIWLKFEDPDGNYDDNVGSYNVAISTTTTSSTFGAMFMDLVDKIKSVSGSASEQVFKGLTCIGSEKTGNCSEFRKTINAMLLMYVAVFGFLFLFGIIQTNHFDFVTRIVKVAVVIILLRDDSYDFFNDYLFQAFIGLSDTLIANATGAPISNPFDFLDQSIAVVLLDSNTYFKILGLLLQGLIGIVVFILLIYAVIAFVIAIFNAFVIYIMSYLGLAICLAIAPIFIAFLLFKQTQHLFDGWFKSMVRFTIQPVILFIGLIFLNGMLTALLEQIFNFRVCFKCAIPYNFVLPGFDSVGTSTVFCAPWFTTWGGDNFNNSTSASTIVAFPLAITFCMVTNIMKVYSSSMSTKITMKIVEGLSLFTGATKGGGGMDQNPFADIYNAGKGLIGMGKGDVFRRGQALRRASMKKNPEQEEGNSKSHKKLPRKDKRVLPPSMKDE